MPIIPKIAAAAERLTAWRRQLHANPEIAFQEHQTAEFIAARLAEMGIAVHRGLAGTGVVGTLEGKLATGGKQRAIGLRAEIDALPIEEKNQFAHCSKNPGRMHACGHDGHTTMLLGAAAYLAETRNFAGKVQFIFQPAEENEGGGKVMVEQGLFDKFPVESVYGLHNWPGMAVGQFAVRPGPMMAAFDVFEIVVAGRGAHGAMPNLGIDPVLAAAHVVTALQSIASRNTDPLDSVVVSVTQIRGGDTWNVIPDDVVLRGTARSFRTAVQDMTESNMRRIAEQTCAAFGATASVRYERRYPATVNTVAETDFAAATAADIVGDGNVDRAPNPSMGGEDFAFMLQQRPGSYIWAGNGPVVNGGTLHNPHYDFNDDLLPVGASYWARLVERLL